MEEERIRKELQDIIVWGVNRSGLLYNKERLAHPEKYDFRFQWDHYWYQVRRSTDPGFARHMNKISHESPNFLSNRSFVMKTVLRDICYGQFNIEELSGSKDIDSFHEKSKTGDYDPRQSRRRANEELRNLIYKKGRTDKRDSRIINYGTAFDIGSEMGGPIPEVARKLLESEESSYSDDHARAVSTCALVKEVFPERWDDLRSIQKEMLNIYGKFDPEAIRGRFYSVLREEINAFSPIFVILGNHINSLCEIFWFMKKNEAKRAILMFSDFSIDLKQKDLRDSVDLMLSVGRTPSDLAAALPPVAYALMDINQVDLALILYDELLSLEIRDDDALPILLEKISALRNLGRYEEMLTASQHAMSMIPNTNDIFFYWLLKIRHAEALSFNGMNGEAIKILEDCFARRNELSSDYVPYISLEKAHTAYAVREKEIQPEKLLTPQRISLLMNLVMGAWRIKEYCLCKKYIEELFATEREYFKREEKIDVFLNLNKAYNQVIFLCNKTSIREQKQYSS